MLGSTKMFRFLGINVYFHWTFVPLFAWIMFAFAMTFSSRSMGLPFAFQIFFTLSAVFLFFFSLFAHEYTHCLVARYYGIKTDRIIVLFCGMAASLDFPKVYKKGPGTEFKIAVAGPLASLLLSIFFFVAYTLFLNWVPEKYTLMGANIFNPMWIIFYILIRFNFIVALFNFLPGFPMDGGRILRSFLWWINKDLLRATKIACFAGKVIMFTVFPAIGYFVIGSWISVAILLCIGVFVLIPAGDAELKKVIELSNKKD